MVLNYIWIGFFLLSFVVATVKLMMGDTMVFKTMMDGVFSSAKTSVDISVGLIGVMSLFLGFMNIGEKAGAVNFLSRIVGPFFGKLFPELPKNHPAFGTMMMSFSANMLGLDNAATPFSLKAMKSLQEINPSKDTASNAQIMFMVLNASGLTIIPVSIIAQRSILGSKNPTEVFLPLLLATFVATIVAMAVTAIWQKFTRKQWYAILAFALGGAILITGLGYLIRYILSPEGATAFSNIVSNGVIMLIFILFIIGGLIKKVQIFNAFIDGAKQGLMVCIKIIPYLVAMLVAISLFRNSGVFEFIIQSISWSVAALGFDTQWVAALPTAIMKPLSGSGARGMMIDAMTQYGPDSLVGRLACVFQGTTETTFYIVAVYFGSVNIKNTRHAVPASLIADVAGVIAAILIVYNWPWSS